MAVLLIVSFLLGSLAELPLKLVDHSLQVVYFLVLAICGLSNVWLALHDLPHIFPNCLRLGPPMYSLTHSHAWLPKRINLQQGSVYQPMEYNLPSFLKKQKKKQQPCFSTAQSCELVTITVCLQPQCLLSLYCKLNYTYSLRNRWYYGLYY